jgi:hypothetical protein
VTAEDIANAARVRLAALDEQAKPHEEALATINAERARLRAMLDAAEGKPKPAYVPTWMPHSIGTGVVFPADPVIALGTGGATNPSETVVAACGAFDLAAATESFARLGINTDRTMPVKAVA